MTFVDTWAWVALADRSDPNHSKVTVQHQQWQQAKQLYVTTDFVLNEVITYLYDALSAAQAQSFISSVFAATNAGTYQLVHVSPQQF